MLGLSSEFMMACRGLLEKGTFQNPEMCVIKALTKDEQSHEFHPSTGEKVTTQETIS